MLGAPLELLAEPVAVGGQRLEAILEPISKGGRVVVGRRHRDRQLPECVQLCSGVENEAERLQLDKGEFVLADQPLIQRAEVRMPTGTA